MRDYISFSALKKWNECPFAYKLAYVDGIKKFFGNDESCFNLFPSLSSATAPINFPSIKRQAEESE